MPPPRRPVGDDGQHFGPPGRREAEGFRETQVVADERSQAVPPISTATRSSPPAYWRSSPAKENGCILVYRPMALPCGPTSRA